MSNGRSAKAGQKGGRSPMAAQWFGRAEDFRRASNILSNDLALPKVVCSAFSAEAYLKCLLTLRGKPFRRTHDLRHLFRKLPESDQLPIEMMWNMLSRPKLMSAALGNPGLARAYPPPATLDQALSQAAEAFLDFRYNVDGAMGFFLFSFPGYVRAQICQVEPSWQENPPNFFGIKGGDGADPAA